MAEEMKDRQERIIVVDQIKAAACIMIFLYHCNTILPGEWKFLTLLGQDLGNNLFFMVSGFALAPSIGKSGWRDFPKWYLKRIKRILPMTVIAYAAAYIMGIYSFTDPKQLYAVFVYPTLYWFVSAILIYYILLFIIDKSCKDSVKYIILAIVFVLLYIYADSNERLYFIGFLSMMQGYLLRKRIDGGKDKASIDIKTIINFLFSAAFYLLGKNSDFAGISNLIACIGVLGIGEFLLLLGKVFNDELTVFFRGKEKILVMLKFIGDMALPVYLVQCFASGFIGFWLSLNVAFPLSFLYNFLIVWSVAVILYLLTSVKKCFKRLK